MCLTPLCLADADIVPFTASSEEPLLRLSLEEPFLADAEKATVSAVQASFAVAENLRRQLEEVAAALCAAAALPVDANGAVDLQKLQSHLQGYKEAEDRLRTLSPRIAARIFFVDGEKARAMLRSRVQRLKDQMCSQALAWAESEISGLHEAWAEALEKASMVPTSEQELIELKKYLAVVHQQTAPLITRGQSVSNLLALLEGHFVFPPLRVQKQAFELDCCPMRLKMALCETNGILDLAKERLEARRQVSAQHLQVESEALRIEVDAAATMFKHVEDASTYLPVLEKLGLRVQAARLEVENLRKAEGLFGLEASEFEELEGVCVVFDRLNELWTAANNFVRSREIWQTTSLAHLDCDEVEEQLQQWRQVASSTRRVAGVFRSVEPLQACDKLLQAISSFQKMLPLMKTVTHPSFQAKHWQELAARLNVDTSGEGEGISLNALLQKGLPEATQAVEVIGSAALREFRTKACFQKMRGAWRALRMELVTFGSEDMGRKMLKGFDAVNSLIEEHQASVQSLQASQLVGGVEVQAREWIRKLSELETLCNLLEACQVSWVYLMPIFDYPEMQQQLAKEAELLNAVGSMWKEEVIGRLDDNASLLDLADLEELPQKLRSACSDMQLVVRGLNDFLEKKRLAFPRFFFLSNEELVQLLAGASHAEALAPHVQKCFEGIHSLNFDQQSKEANFVFSHRKETLPLLTPVRLVKDGQPASIEDIFSSIEREMCAALQQAMQKAWEEFPSAPSRMAWTTEICACAQAALAIAHCCWTAQVETAIVQHQLPQLVKDLQNQLQQVVQAVRGPLSPKSRSALATLLTLDVHCRDVTEELMRSKTSHITQFEWICHLRSYWTPAAHHLGGAAGSAGFLVAGRGPNKGGNRGSCGSLQLSMVESCLYYGFELLRSPDRLVVTPLTDRCYRTLMTALHFQYGGAPEGPAGTGKTETTKDLAKAAGKPCLVFNCSEGLDAAAMAALLKGLAASGGWCCFDEFNRLQLDVLSIVALQISAIQQAIRRKAITFVFEDTDLQLNPTCAINITMNPGYAGRSILPDTLKALFRPCTMMVPDAALIAEVMLYCSGFQDAFKLSKKMVTCLQLASEQLARRGHYDFGMRAAVAVLNTAKHLFLQQLKPSAVVASSPSKNSCFHSDEAGARLEAMTLCKALRLTNVPKLHPTDKLIFEEILKDVFDESDLAAAESDQSLRPFLKEAAEQLLLEPSEELITKSLQVLHTLDHRHGLMLVGSSATGKTSAVKCLVLALELQRKANAAAAAPVASLTEGRSEADGEQGLGNGVSSVPENAHGEDGKASPSLHDCFDKSIDGGKGFRSTRPKCIAQRIFPKALEVEELYGSLDPTTREWRGGALEQAIRDASQEQDSTVSRWIILDGPVDVGWVENLNTVLDDNKKLCLSSGEVILLSPQTSLLFEVTDLRCASPATVSRCGMVYIHQDVLQWKSLLHSWSRHSPTAKLLGDAVVKDVTQTMRECCTICIAFLAKCKGGPLNISPSWMVLNVLRLFDALVAQIVEPAQRGEGAVADLLEQSLEGALVFALLWGAGGTLSASERPAFEAAFRNLHSGRYEVLEQMGLLPGGQVCGNEKMDHEHKQKQTRRFNHHLPPTGSCFDVFWDVQQKKWYPWASLPMLPDVRKGAAVTSAALQHVLIETPETALLNYFLGLVAAPGKAPFLLVGEAGGGKSKCMIQMLQEMAMESQQKLIQQMRNQEAAAAQQTRKALVSPSEGLPATASSKSDAFTFLALSLTGAATPNAVQQWLESRLEKTHSVGLRPVGFRRCILLLDDVHLPPTEESGAQPVGELVRQLLECGGWSKGGGWKFHPVEGLTLTATRRILQQQHQHNERLARHFFPLTGVPYSTESLQTILNQLLLIRFDSCAEGVVEGLKKVSVLTAHLYRLVQQRLPLRPSRWMQQWTPRDCWRVVQRMGFLNPIGLQSQHQLLCCWLHEVRRVFEDRTANAPDLDILSGSIGDLLKETTGFTLNDLDPPKQGPLLFAFREPEAGATTGSGRAATAAEDCILGSRVYERVTALEAHQMCAAALEQYSLLYPNKPLSLVLFPQAVEHALRCMNTFLQPQGHMLLLGVGGSGRRSCARLAAFLAGFGVVESQGVSHSVAMSEWQEDIKSTILATGVLKKPQLLLVPAEHLAHDGVAADVCTMLQLREIPDVFTADEKAEAVSALRVKVSSAPGESDSGVVSTQSGADPALSGKPIAQQKLLSVSSALQQYDSALPSIQQQAANGAEELLSHPSADPNEKIKLLCGACADIFESTKEIAECYREEQRRFFYVTPASFLRLLDGFCHIFMTRASQHHHQQQQYELGLQKLHDVSQQVMEMQQQLEKLQPELAKASAETQQLMQVLTAKQEHAASTMSLVEAEERECKTQADAAAAAERECQDHLAEAMPALLAAEEALKKLSKADITELKSMKAPPSGVVKVMEALCKLFGVTPIFVQVSPSQPRQADYWQTGKKHLLGSSRFLQRLLNFDRDTISPNVMAAIAPYDEDADFDPEIVNKASVAATSLCLWVKALIAYDRANNAVRPRRAALQQAQSELHTAEAVLRDKKEELLQLETLIAQLSQQYQQALQRSEALQQEAQTCERRLSVAEKLIASLGGERLRWSQSHEILKGKVARVTGDATLSAAFIEFGGIFRPSYRVRCLSSWQQALNKFGLQSTPTYSLQDALTSPQEVQQWLMQGLPDDELSIENAAITLSAQCCPMLIDPHQQAANWLAYTFPDMKVLRAEEPNLLRSLQLLMQCGAVVILECFSERLEPALNNLLEWKRPRNASSPFGASTFLGGARTELEEGTSSSVVLGNALVEVHPEFRLLLKTPLNAPHFPPEVCSRLTLIDFSVGCKGLEQRLLRLALQAAAPDIHATCLRLVHEGAETRAQLVSAEQRMLEALSNAKESVLDDLELLSTLRHAKAVSESCSERLQEQQKAQAAADATLSLYSPVARRAASLFEVLQQLESAHPMYLFSVQVFQQCFVDAVVEVLGRPDVSTRQQDASLYTADLVEATLRRVYRSINPCLFENHKPLLPILLALQSLQLRGAATHDELQQLQAPLVLPYIEDDMAHKSYDPSSAASRGIDASWLSTSSREKLEGLCRLGEPFKSLVSSVLEGQGDWEAALYEENPLASDWPDSWNERLSLLQQTLLVQCVRPECLRSCLQQVSEAELGTVLGETAPVGLGEALESAGPKSPLLIILGPGADPQAALLQHAEATHMRNKFVSVAMGKGQGPKAASAIRSGAESGQWVLLQNCHLGLGFLKQLSVIVSDLAMQTPHKDFRLILTTVPCDDFPSAILLRSLKLAYEPPQGLRQNLIRIYSEAFPTWLQLQAAVPPDGLQPLPWGLLQHLVSEVNYGGRVTDEWDRRLLYHLCREGLSEESLKQDPGQSPFGAFMAPSPSLTCAETLAHIRTLPAEEEPELFGLQANAAMAVATAESSAMQHLLMRVQQQQVATPSSGSTASAGGSSSELTERAVSLMAQLPPLFNVEEVIASRVNPYENAMDAALIQELARYNALITITQKSLQVVQVTFALKTDSK
ncbi:hypothetical protein EPH_0001780 [Eimeria praecox]|uniref:Uncharacterized protein n=1 Tax=Eimeria praecox TaxID=51316 RepID=U6G3X4_9EIME|nr:hypothetical protein EPH_0001780 [Eimeria praecox]